MFQSNARIYCFFCGYKSKGKKDLQEHCGKHTQERPYFCPECPRELRSKISLKCHLETHKPREERENMECPHCGKQFLSKNGLSDHIKAHGERIYDLACNVCDKAFSSKGLLRTHKAGAHGGMRHGCHICGKLFNWKTALRRHLFTHAPERKRFKCEKCSKSFIKKSAYEEHRHIHQDQEYSFKCDKCDRGYFTSARLKDHQRAIHLEKSFPFSCLFCKKRFKAFCNIERHLFSHTLERPYLCKRCPAEFNRQEGLSLHNKKTHCKIKEHFKCVMCTKSFQTKRHLDNHIRHHMGELHLKCQIPGCGMRFVSYDHRRRHRLKVHVGKQFPCTVCGKQFFTKNRLKGHALIHSDLRGFLCRICGSGFKQLSGRRQHEHSVHGL